ncbi:uncharacterized protein LOC125235264 [Leguminivora glycinivorella]|uniref:uncharacterized protein LOC125235264 n=1 Tax=Leguminivora glycinivorella TaxID=1035111 RepID=UPI00200E3B95|nr:uncharacterized protein LOC125235264 [Leguminivora glycinivorella]
MGGVDLELSKEIKILGLIIDEKLTFNQHVLATCRKATAIHKQLTRAAKVSWGLQPEIIRTIYTAVIEPIIMYAASAWAPAAKKLCIRNHLNAVQRSFAQKICKAYRTVSLNSALLLSGLLPLDLRIQEAAKIFEAKRGIPQPLIGDRELELKASHTAAPHPAESKSFSYECEDQETEEDSHDVRLFTDGSKIQNKVGASLSCWNNGVEIKAHKYKLESYCTVFQAEMYAVLKATEFVLRSDRGSFGIYSDSRSTLEIIGNQGSFNPIAVEIRKNLADIQGQAKEIKLYWVRAHVGTVGNERADTLAKEAALKIKTKPYYDRCPISFIKKSIRLETLEEWGRRYSTESTASGTKMFYPDAVEAYPEIKKLKLNPILVQIMTGHGGFSEYLHRFKCKESPSCVCEPGKAESIPHLIAECPQFITQRFNLENEMEEEIRIDTIHKIMKNKYIRGKFLEFCVKIATIVIKLCPGQ